eukprot:724493-Prymnesium_polylepis.1
MMRSHARADRWADFVTEHQAFWLADGARHEGTRGDATAAATAHRETAVKPPRETAHELIAALAGVRAAAEACAGGASFDRCLIVALYCSCPIATRLRPRGCPIATRLPPCYCPMLARLPPDCHPIATRLPPDCHPIAARFLPDCDPLTTRFLPLCPHQRLAGTTLGAINTLAALRCPKHLILSVSDFDCLPAAWHVTPGT